jgi:hypothetical protein
MAKMQNGRYFKQTETGMVESDAKEFKTCESEVLAAQRAEEKAEEDARKALLKGNREGAK